MNLNALENPKESMALTLRRCFLKPLNDVWFVKYWSEERKRVYFNREAYCIQTAIFRGGICKSCQGRCSSTLLYIRHCNKIFGTWVDDHINKNRNNSQHRKNGLL